MFSQLRNIDTAFKHIRAFSIVVIVAFTALSGLTVWKSHESVNIERERIYILYNGKVIEAMSGMRRDNLPVELREHIRNFHLAFFTLDPDEKVIQANISRALNLADESAKKAYDNLREQGFYANLISANISQRITVDSIALDLNKEPFRFTCYATQQLIRSTSTAVRRLVTVGEVRGVSRSDNNAHGFLIQRWETVQNPDIDRKTRP